MVGLECQTKSLRYQKDMAYCEVNACGQSVRTSTEYDQPLGVVLYEHAIATSNVRAVYELAAGDPLISERHHRAVFPGEFCLGAQERA